VIATGVCIAGIALAWILHAQNRALADRLRASFLANPVLRVLPLGSEHGWWFDGLYNRLFAVPAWITAQVLSFLDRVVLDGVVVAAVGRIPAVIGRIFQPLYVGTVQGYALTMAGGIGLIIAWVVWVWLKGGAQ
jgi:NADH:ubiquinone oxidoreductase subunit 5 (subunit L)/multisubunit Na+/H+ antiporter MnhA subunit